MMGWKKALLGDLITIKHGWAFKGQFFASDGQFIVVTPGNFVDEGGFRTREGKEKFYTDVYPKDYLLKKGDLVIAMTEQGPGLLGSPGLIPESNKYLHNQRIGLLNIIQSNNLDKKFLYYLFFTDTVRNKIFGSATGTKVKHTAPKRIYNIEVYLPPLSNQRRIASILSAYDDLIENNLRRIKLLEELAQRTYEEWFVKFTINGEKLPLNEETGLPEKWVMKKLGEVVELKYGKALKSEDRDGGEYQVFGSSGIVGSHSDYLVKGPSVILGRKGNVGSVFWSSNDFYPIDTVYFINSDLSKYFVYYLLKSITFINNDAAVPGLNRNAAYMMDFIMPSNKNILKFEEFAYPIFHEINNFQNQNRLLKESRDILLPRLMSGKINVEEAEEQLAIAAEPGVKYEKK